MGNKFKAVIILAVVIVVVGVLAVIVSNDSELDKPIYVTFTGIEDETCYAAPFCYDFDAKYIDFYDQKERNNELVNGFAYNYVQECDDPAVFNAFCNYTDFSKLTFMYAIYNIKDGDQICMPYDTPDIFKVVLYYPISDKFVITRVASKFADKSYFKANYDLDNDIFQMQRQFFFFKDFLMYFLQVALSTIAIFFVAKMFDYRKKEELKVIMTNSVISLLVLNLLTLVIKVFIGVNLLIYSYAALVLLAFIFQYGIYSKRLAFNGEEIDKERPIIFAFAANCIAFGICVIIAVFIFG